MSAEVKLFGRWSSSVGLCCSRLPVFFDRFREVGGVSGLAPVASFNVLGWFGIGLMALAWLGVLGSFQKRRTLDVGDGDGVVRATLGVRV